MAGHVRRVHLQFAAVFRDGRHQSPDVGGQNFDRGESRRLDGGVHGLLAVLLGLDQGVHGLDRVVETDSVFGGYKIPEELALAAHFPGFDHQLVVIGR